MSHRTRQPINSRSYPTQLRDAIGKFLPQSGLSLISADQRMRWTDRMLTITAILFAWADQRTLAAAFDFARQFVVRMYPTRRRPGAQFRGFMRALSRAHERLLPTVTAALRRAMDRVGLTDRLGGHWRVLAVDGTRIACPRTVANEQAFGVSGKSKSYPQQQLTTLFAVGSGLPWTWRRGRGKTAERTHLRQMLPELPACTLLLADAGFVGFDLMGSIQQAGHDFIIRAGRNVRLLWKLGYATREYDGVVYLWPKDQRGKRPPLILRLVTLHDGRKPVHLLTTVLDRRRLSDASIGALYRRRWGVEVLFRSLKQTMERTKLRSRSPRSAQLELDWSLVGLWMLGLLVLDAGGGKALGNSGPWSVALALAVLHSCITTHCRSLRSLRKMLAESRVDAYVRSGPKSTRSHRRKKTEPPAGTPILRIATADEQQAAQALKRQRRAS